jgi:hypothetical protein
MMKSINESKRKHTTTLKELVLSLKPLSTSLSSIPTSLSFACPEFDRPCAIVNGLLRVSCHSGVVAQPAILEFQRPALTRVET